jgi:hypothetical protein
MKLNFLSKGLTLVILSICFYSCDPGNITCPGLEPEFSEWLPYKANDIVIYVDSNGQEIKFVVNKYELSTTKTLDCGPNGLGGSKCPTCPQRYSSVNASSQDTSRQKGKIIYRNLNSSVGKREGKNDSVYLSYYVFDHSNDLTISPSLIPNSTDSILPTFSAGGRTYSNVIVHQVDTTATPYSNPIYNVYFVWKSYYNKEFGVIAFYDLKTRTFFYRKR